MFDPWGFVAFLGPDLPRMRRSGGQTGERTRPLHDSRGELPPRRDPVPALHLDRMPAARSAAHDDAPGMPIRQSRYQLRRTAPG